jgi:hypothetical protein
MRPIRGAVFPFACGVPIDGVLSVSWLLRSAAASLAGFYGNAANAGREGVNPLEPSRPCKNVCASGNFE